MNATGTLLRSLGAPGGWARVVALTLACIGCAQTREDAVLATPGRQHFETHVWPVLVRDCGFQACHGSQDRFFRVLGPGHERLDPETWLSAPVTEAEMELSYERARSMLDPDEPAKSPLLRKPLEVEAGGSGHEGTDVFGRDVYRTVNDPGFQVIAEWARGQGRLP